MTVQYSETECLSYEEYVAFLKRSDLGSQYPRKDFRQRIERLLSNRDVGVTARDVDGTLIGVCFGITDFAYFLFVTDLGVDRGHTGQGIGRELLRRAHDAAGGEEDIVVYADTHRDARGFYKRCGMRLATSVMVKEAKVWDLFDVRTR